MTIALMDTLVELGHAVYLKMRKHMDAAHLQVKVICSLHNRTTMHSFVPFTGAVCCTDHQHCCPEGEIYLNNRVVFE